MHDAVVVICALVLRVWRHLQALLESATLLVEVEVELLWSGLGSG